MPTKRLPANADLQHLKYQARDLLEAHRYRRPQACQRIREFHPRFARASDAVIGEAELVLSDAQLAIAREHGFASWAKLKTHVAGPSRDAADKPHHERIGDAAFRRAVDLLDAGNAGALRAQLAAHPRLVTQRVRFEGENYFREPALLEFTAENPIRHGTLPSNIVEIAKVILDAGAARDRSSVNETLALVCSGRVPRECGVQTALADLLCDAGADPNGAMLPALAHGEFEAVAALIHRGATVDLKVVAATGRASEARRLLPGADGAMRHAALALAAQHGHPEIVRLLLDAGEDPNRYNPMGLHSHSVPLHQAVAYGHRDVVRELVERGADVSVEDIVHHGTPLGWAIFTGHTEIAEYLRAHEAAQDAEC